jgi:hypothetical protein
MFIAGVGILGGLVGLGMALIVISITISALISTESL